MKDTYTREEINERVDHGLDRWRSNPDAPLVEILRREFEDRPKYRDGLRVLYDMPHSPDCMNRSENVRCFRDATNIRVLMTTEEQDRLLDETVRNYFARPGESISSSLIRAYRELRDRWIREGDDE